MIHAKILSILIIIMVGVFMAYTYAEFVTPHNRHKWEWGIMGFGISIFLYMILILGFL